MYTLSKEWTRAKLIFRSGCEDFIYGLCSEKVKSKLTWEKRHKNIFAKEWHQRFNSIGSGCFDKKADFNGLPGHRWTRN